MTPAETVLLTRYVHALCPGQPIDEYTPDAWHDVLGHLELADARTAASAVATRQPFVAPSEIIGEVNRSRATRLTAGAEPAPAADPDDPAAYAQALRDQRSRLASGEQPARPSLPPAAYRDPAPLIEQARRSIRRPPPADTSSRPPQTLPMSPPGMDTIICTCGGHFLDTPAGHEAHRVVFEHTPRPPRNEVTP